jgi:hypothetical protein
MFKKVPYEVVKALFAFITICKYADTPTPTTHISAFYKVI